MPQTFNFIDKSTVGAAFNAAQDRRLKLEAGRRTLAEEERKAAVASGIDIAGREAVRAQFAEPAAPAPSPGFAGGPSVGGVAPAGAPSPRLPSARPARAPAAGFQRDLARRLAEVPGGGAGAVAAIQAADTQQTAADAQQIEFETNAFAELYKGNVEAAQAWAQRAGITFPPDLLANKQAAKLLGGAMTAGSKFYKNPQQLSKFVEGVVRSGGDWKEGWDAAGPPVENPTFTYQQAVIAGKNTLVQIGTTPSGAMTTKAVPGLGGKPLEMAPKGAAAKPQIITAKDGTMYSADRAPDGTVTLTPLKDAQGKPVVGVPKGAGGSFSAAAKRHSEATGLQIGTPEFQESFSESEEGAAAIKAATKDMKEVSAETGNAIGTEAFRQDWQAFQKLGGGGGKTFRIKIKETLATHPEMTRRQAVDMVLGFVRLSVNVATGAKTLVNMITGEVDLLDDPTRLDIGERPKEETLYGRVSKRPVSGVVPGVGEVLANTVGQIPGVPIAEQVVKDRQAFRTEQGVMIRAFSINPKFPAAEIKRIKEELNIEPNIWTSDRALIARMESIAKSLTNRMVDQQELANDQGEPTKDRSSARTNATSIRNFLRILGVPGFSAGGQPGTERRARSRDGGATAVPPGGWPHGSTTIKRGVKWIYDGGRKAWRRAREGE